MATRKKSTRTTKQKPGKELLEKVDRLSEHICVMNEVLFGLKAERNEAHRSPELLVIRAAAAHGHKASAEALQLVDDIMDTLKGEGVQHGA